MKMCSLQELGLMEKSTRVCFMLLHKPLGPQHCQSWSKADHEVIISISQQLYKA